MFQKYLIQTIRDLKFNRGYFLINVLVLLNKIFAAWVLLARIAMNKWLQNIVYKTERNCQSWRAAYKNPVESLRYE
jgi:hypothetical protein